MTARPVQLNIGCVGACIVAAFGVGAFILIVHGAVALARTLFG